MLKDIIDVQPLEGYRLALTFEDGLEGVIDVQALVPFTGLFKPLKDPAYFRQVEVNPDIGTVCWPNQADLDPDVLYALVAKQPLPAYVDTTAQ
jgi:hypothetical protein